MLFRGSPNSHFPDYLFIPQTYGTGSGSELGAACAAHQQPCLFMRQTESPAAPFPRRLREQASRNARAHRPPLPDTCSNGTPAAGAASIGSNLVKNEVRKLWRTDFESLHCTRLNALGYDHWFLPCAKQQPSSQDTHSHPTFCRHSSSKSSLLLLFGLIPNAKSVPFFLITPPSHPDCPRWSPVGF